MNKIIVIRYSTKPIQSLSDTMIVYKHPIELEVEQELELKRYKYKGYEFTVKSITEDLDNNTFIYETNPVWVPYE